MYDIPVKFHISSVFASKESYIHLIMQTPSIAFRQSRTNHIPSELSYLKVTEKRKKTALNSLLSPARPCKICISLYDACLLDNPQMHFQRPGTKR